MAYWCPFWQLCPGSADDGRNPGLDQQPERRRLFPVNGQIYFHGLQRRHALGRLQPPVYRNQSHGQCQDAEIRYSRKKPVIFSHQQIQIIFHAFPVGHKYYAPCMIAYCTGLRVGECLALQWSHIDMENRTLSVVSTLYDKRVCLSAKATPKTKSSVRTIL